MFAHVSIGFPEGVDDLLPQPAPRALALLCTRDGVRVPASPANSATHRTSSLPVPQDQRPDPRQDDVPGSRRRTTPRQGPSRLAPTRGRSHIARLVGHADQDRRAIRLPGSEASGRTKVLSGTADHDGRAGQGRREDVEEGRCLGRRLELDIGQRTVSLPFLSRFAPLLIFSRFLLVS